MPLGGFGSAEAVRRGDDTLQRVVREGKIVTAAGVSAGIDMALHLADWECGDDYAKMIQLVCEYDPQPPFDCLSPLKAPAAIVEKTAAHIAAGWC